MYKETKNLQKPLIIGNGGKEKLLFNRKTPPAEPGSDQDSHLPQMDRGEGKYEC